MGKSTVVLLALSALAVHSAVLNKDETLLKRLARSPCEECGGPRGFPPPPPPLFPPPPPLFPPPPPPRFRSHNWSGYARSPDGAAQGVFSGAAAAADFGSQPDSEAFSIASASGNAAGGASSFSGSASKGSYGAKSGFESDRNTQAQSNGFNGGNFHSSNDKESRYSYQSGKHFEGEGSKSNGRGDIDVQGPAQSGSYANSGASTNQGFSGNEQQRPQLGGSFGNGGSQSQSAGLSSHGKGYSGNQQQHANQEEGFSGNEYHQNGNEKQGFSGNNQQQHANLDEGFSNNGQQQRGNHGGYSGGGQNYVSGSSSNAQSGALSGQDHGRHGNKVDYSDNQHQVQTEGQTGAGSERATGQDGASLSADSSSLTEGQSALNGALNLASQGLQTAEGCSTCGKSSYALSNAKSHSGNAIAVSIGG